MRRYPGLANVPLCRDGEPRRLMTRQYREVSLSRPITPWSVQKFAKVDLHVAFSPRRPVIREFMTYVISLAYDSMRITSVSSRKCQPLSSSLPAERVSNVLSLFANLALDKNRHADDLSIDSVRIWTKSHNRP